MRFLYVVPLLFTLTLGFKFVRFEHDAHAKEVEFLKTQIVELIKKNIVNKPKSDLVFDKITSSTANLNDYVDKLLPKVNQAILDDGLDPTGVEDQKINIGIGTSTLTEGNLSKLSTMERYQNVTVTYDNATNKADLEFILRWEDLVLVYKYHTKVVLISITGHVTANVQHMKIHLKLGFDFNSKHVTVDSLDFNHTGDISLKFSGNGLIDYITNAMTKVFTTIFHNLIISTVKKHVMDPVQTIVDDINKAIDDFLNPSGL